MVKDTKHATAVQQRRVAAGRRGYAKAVRRFMRRCRQLEGPIPPLRVEDIPVTWAERPRAPEPEVESEHDAMRAQLEALFANSR